MKKQLYLGGALALCAIVLSPSAQAEADSGLDALTLLPQDTAFVFSVDMQRMHKSSLAKDLFALAAKSSDFADTQKKLTDEAGLSIERDIDTMLIAIAGDIDKADQMVFIAQGRFDQAKLTAFLKKDAPAFSERKHRGVRYYALGDDSEFTFIGKYLVATPKSGMTKVIDAYKGKAPSAKNAQLARLLDKTYTSRSVWFALLLTDAMKKEIADGAQGHSMDSMVAGIDIGADISIASRLDASDAKAASSLQVFFKDAANVMAAEPSLQMIGLDKAFKNMKVEAGGSKVKIELTVPGASVQQLLPLLQGAL